MKTNYLFTLLLISLFALQVTAQNKGSISPEMIQKIRAAQPTDAANKALMNALTGNDIKKLVLNRQNIGKTDHFFKYKVDVKGISDQKSSGRCWMFTSLNVVRYKVIKKLNLSSFEFSENYLYFWDLFEKSNLFLEATMKYADKPMDDRQNDWLFSNGVSDGGVWSSFTNLAGKYGLVPKEVMPETNSSSNTGWICKMITRKIREDGMELRNLVVKKTEAKKIEQRKLEMLTEIYHMLVLNLGEPPTEFAWRYKDKDNKISPLKTYTPLSFIQETIGDIDLNEYVMLMNDPTRDYYKLYEIEYDRNVMEGRNWLYINLPNADIKKFALESIKNNEALYASCDVGQQLNSDEGLCSLDNYDYEALYGIKFGMDKKNRILTKESGSSHGMALVAVDVDSLENPVKWQFENSWGSTSGKDGYLTFTDGWFNEFLFRAVILKKFIDPKILEILKQKPVVLPAWDPMFMMDE